MLWSSWDEGDNAGDSYGHLHQPANNNSVNGASLNPLLQITNLMLSNVDYYRQFKHKLTFKQIWSAKGKCTKIHRHSCNYRNKT